MSESVSVSLFCITCLSFKSDTLSQAQSITVTFNSLELMTCHWSAIFM